LPGLKHYSFISPVSSKAEHMAGNMKEEGAVDIVVEVEDGDGWPWSVVMSKR
jgi:hypothetical protein